MEVDDADGTCEPSDHQGPDMEADDADDTFKPPDGVDYGPDVDDDIDADGDDCFIGPIPHYDREEYKNWESVRVKLDALHALMRYERTLRKSHGAYQHFLSRLRDAVFVVNEDDLSSLKQILKERCARRFPAPKCNSTTRDVRHAI